MTIVTDALWLAARGRSKGTGDSRCLRACLSVCVQRSINSLLTDRTSVSVMFWVIRSNSAPLNSGSMAYFPEFSPKATRPIAMVWRKGRMAGVNCREVGGMDKSKDRL
uniref:Uncharacterized protein n=1 Tax=Seriola dumerili TaxID=41447 RepID=A0A3B4T6D9_SERDU